jgi:cell division protein FtsL
MNAYEFMLGALAVLVVMFIIYAWYLERRILRLKAKVDELRAKVYGPADKKESGLPDQVVKS